MDRLSSLITVGSAVLLLSCGGDSKPKGGEPPPQRTQMVAAPTKAAPKVEEFCETPGAGKAPADYAWPALKTEAPQSAGRWTWVNVWATWCGPCIEEMPMLGQWEKKLQAEGVGVDLRFLSVDGGEAEVKAFQSKHPGSPPTLQIASLADMQPWMDRLALGTAVLPIHIFVDNQAKLRCSRMGALSEADYDVVKAVLSAK
jgi:thiol-disulfide isomerase/thioredoxin